jgi:two-component system OmpR family response regulator
VELSTDLQTLGVIWPEDACHTGAMAPPKDAEGKTSVLVVEDDQLISDVVRLGLRYEGFAVEVCADGLAALRLAEQLRPDAVVLDWMLPGMEGIELVKRLRAFGEPSVVMLTAKDALEDRVAGLEAGADDYLVKPFQFEELLARLRAVLRRRGGPSTDRTMRVGELTLDADAHEVTCRGEPVRLSPREFDLLRVLMEQPRRVYSKALLLDRVWGYDYPGDDNVVEVYVGYLREKLGDRPPRLIKNVRGVGYTLGER